MKRHQHLYVATDGELFKIGITIDPPNRNKQLGLGVRFIKLWQRPYAVQIEYAIKGIFSHVCVRGREWFAVTEKEMLFEVYRALRIEDDDQAVRRGRKPSKRGAAPTCPPFKLNWLKIKPVT